MCVCVSLWFISKKFEAYKTVLIDFISMLKNKNALKMSLQMDKKLKIAYLVLSLTGKLIDLFSYCFLTIAIFLRRRAL